MSWFLTGCTGLALGIVALAMTIAPAARFTLTARHPRRPARISPVSALSRLRGWHVVDDVAIDAAVDIADLHVVVAPAAVLAIVTEEHSGDSTPPRDLDAAERAAARVREFLQMRRAGDTIVVPVVWVSGRDAPAISGGHRLVAGVHVVDGDNPAAWLHVFRDARLAGADRLRLCRELDSAASAPRGAARTIRSARPPAADAA